MGPRQILCMLSAMAIMLLSATGKEDKTLQDGYVIHKFLDALACDPAYNDYENCENAMSVMKKSQYDPYEYGSDEESMARYFNLNDLSAVEGKRAHPKVATNCMEKALFADIGPSFYPRYLKNLTCQDAQTNPDDKKCKKRCHPVHYKTLVLTRRDGPLDGNEDNERHLTLLPNELRRRWKFTEVEIIAGCMCGH